MSSDPHAYATIGVAQGKRPHACVLTIFGASGDLTITGKSRQTLRPQRIPPDAFPLGACNDLNNKARR